MINGIGLERSKEKFSAVVQLHLDFVIISNFWGRQALLANK